MVTEDIELTFNALGTSTVDYRMLVAQIAVRNPAAVAQAIRDMNLFPEIANRAKFSASLVAMVKSGLRVDAIKRYRDEVTPRPSLKEAVDAVDRFVLDDAAARAAVDISG